MPFLSHHSHNRFFSYLISHNPSHGSLKGCLMPQPDYWRSGCHPLGGLFFRSLFKLYLFLCHVFLSFSLPLLCLFPKGWQPHLSSSCLSPAAACPFCSGCSCRCLPLSFVYPKHPCRVFQLTFFLFCTRFYCSMLFIFLIGFPFRQPVVPQDNIRLVLPRCMPPHQPPQVCLSIPWFAPVCIFRRQSFK